MQQPICTYQVMKKLVHIEDPMSTFGQMTFIQNKYQSSAEILQNGDLLHLYRDFDKIFTLNVVTKESQTQKLKTQEDFIERIRSSQSHLHWKDLGKRNQLLESIYTFFYTQEGEQGCPSSSMIDMVPNDSNRKQQSGKQSKQKIILRSINYVDLKSKFESSDELPKAKNIKSKDQSFLLKDEKIAEYYDSPQRRDLKPMFIQRIADSTSYFILFPTGLIMLVSSNPLALQSKLQLNLKKDEMIVDYSYCISSNRKNQCIWLLDEKQQLWKCFNELSSNSCNWVLQKITVFDTLSHKRFLEPAMNYESYTLTILMYKIKCFNEIGQGDNGQFEYLYAYNGTSTNTIVVKQPKIWQNLEHTNSQAERKELFKILKSQIKVFAITKNQNIICNKIPLRNTYFNNQVALKNKDQETLNSQVANEVEELIYLGLSDQKDAQQKQFRKFLVRRQRSLEIMFTNGLYFWSKLVPNSQINHSFEIQDIILSKNFKHLLVYYSPQGFSSQVKIKTFVKNESENFDDYEHNQLLGAKSQKNITLDQNGSLFCIRVEKFRSTKSSKVIKNIFVDKSGQELTIRIPEILLNKELFDPQNYLERMIQSDDGKILMCGKLILKLNDVQDDLDQIGCIMLVKEHNKIKYRFLSLFESDDQRVIDIVLKKSPESIVTYSFDSLPVYQDDNSDIMYVQNCIDQMTGETSILKIHTDTFICYEIYYSRFRIVHMSIQALLEKKKNSNTHLKRSATVVEQSQIFNEGDNQKKIKNPGKHEKRRLKQQKSHHNQILIESLQRRKSKKYLISLVSQSKTHINIEIIKDQNHIVNQADNLEESKSQEEVNEQSFIKSLKKTFKSNSGNEESDDGTNLKYAHLDFFVNVSVKKELINSSEIVWINNNQLILTLNNEFFLINLKHNDLAQVKGGTYLYGVHNVNMNIFCSLIKRKKCQLTGMVTCREEYIGKKASLALIESQQSIQRMEIASLRRYSLIQQSKKSEDIKNLLFFTPTEELDGGNIFSQLSNNYSVMQPYLEKIDAEFIALMNNNVQNIAMYVKPNLTIINSRVMSDIFQDESSNSILKTKNYQFQKLLDNTESFQVNSGKVHMYQKDISGQNAIDYAFNKNAIFCIKAFVETLLILTDDVSFQNCFDKALLMMISRGMDVKELVSSELFYVSVWKDVPIFSDRKEVTISPYNGEIEDMEFENPKQLFEKSDRLPWYQTFMSFENKDSKESSKSNKEEFEMQFNYILMEDIQGEHKLSLTKVLKDCTDLELFEEEAIQNIIDFKWNTYGYKYYLNKFMLYSIFLVLYYVDLESLPFDKDSPRIKDVQFYALKSICGTIQLMFAIFEMMQVKNEGKEYFLDFWNFFEVFGIILYYYAAFLDIMNTHTSTLNRILFSCSILMSLVKIVYLVRVFKQLNFLVTMLITVVNEIVFFFVLFSIFLLTFAECFNLLEVNVGTYGRLPRLMSHILSVLRCSMGDFSLIDSYSTFDMYDITGMDEFGNEIKDYQHPYSQIWATWSVWVIAIMFLFMIFMNFIIAVIGDSFNKVLEFKKAHDYQQRLMMLYEREVQFTQKDFDNNEFFPQVIIIRKLKENNQIKQSWSNFVTVIKNFIKLQNSKCIEVFHAKSKDQKQHLTNSIKLLETDMTTVYKEIDKISIGVKQISTFLKQSYSSQIPRKSSVIKKMEMRQKEEFSSDSDQSNDQNGQQSHVSKIDYPRFERLQSEKSGLSQKSVVDQLQQMNAMINCQFDQMNEKIEQLHSENQSIRQQIKPQSAQASLFEDNKTSLDKEQLTQKNEEEQKQEKAHIEVINFLSMGNQKPDQQIEEIICSSQNNSKTNIKTQNIPNQAFLTKKNEAEVLSERRPKTENLARQQDLDKRHEVSQNSLKEDIINNPNETDKNIAWRSEASRTSKSETARDQNTHELIPKQFKNENLEDDSINIRNQNHFTPKSQNNSLKNSVRSSQQIKQSIISTRRHQRKEQIKQYELKLQQLKNMDDSDDYLEDVEWHKKKKVAFRIEEQKDRQISFVSDQIPNEEDDYLEEDQETQIIPSSQRRRKQSKKHKQVKY